MAGTTTFLFTIRDCGNTHYFHRDVDRDKTKLVKFWGITLNEKRF